MARLPRAVFPEFGVFHITTRGVGRRDVFLTRDDRIVFLELLGVAVARERWRMLAFCLMTNHYHLVVRGHRVLISKGMQRLNGLYARHFNDTHRWCGHLWGDRFALWQIRDETHLEATCAYVLANPVRAGLCEAATDWPWSWAVSPRRGERGPSRSHSRG